MRGGKWGWPGLKMVAPHRPLYKVSFHGEGGLLTGRVHVPSPSDYAPVINWCAPELTWHHWTNPWTQVPNKNYKGGILVLYSIFLHSTSPPPNFHYMVDIMLLYGLSKWTLNTEFSYDYSPTQNKYFLMVFMPLISWSMMNVVMYPLHVGPISTFI